MLLNTFLINSKIQKTIKHKKLLDVGKNMYPKILYNDKENNITTNHTYQITGLVAKKNNL